MESIPRKPGIYLIRDSHNGMFYIGSAVDLRKRWSLHRSDLNIQRHHSLHMQRVWNKYGTEIFEFHILEFVENPADLLVAEQKWFDFYGIGTRADCYNTLTRAGSAFGHKRSSETCARLSAAMIGKKHTPEAKAKMRAAKLGRKLSPSVRKQLKLERPYRRKITPDVESQIKALRKNGWSAYRIANHLSCGETTIRRYLSREDCSRILKISPDQIAEARRMRSDGCRLKDICDAFSISLTHASRIAKGCCRKETQ